MPGKINYSKRDFLALKNEQINYIKQYYPNLIQNYNDASILSLLLDLNAGIADNLHFNIDRALQETVLDYAQERQSLFNIAKTYGLKLPSKAASVSVCNFVIEVPVRGDAEDSRYLPILYAGSQFLSNTITFELLQDIDFGSLFNYAGNVDRTKVPIYINGILSGYRITKTGVVVAGITKIYTHRVTNTREFYQITLPENNVLSIESVIHKNGTNLTLAPSISEFNSDLNKWYEVDSLAEDSIFIEDKITPSENGIYKGEYKTINNRFIKEFTPTGFCILTFGSLTNQGLDILDNFVDNNLYDITNFTNNLSLGYAPYNNTTLYIKYRVGGGVETNVGVGTINTVGQINFKINGPDNTINDIVRNSLTVTNVIPAIGGGNAPTIEEIRQYIGYNFASQNRAVTLNDYKALLLKMPSKFGAPSKVSVSQIQNKININVLSNDINNQLSNTVSSLVLNNIAEYLSKYRMINDYVVVKPANIINIGFDISVLTENGLQISATASIIDVVKNEFEKSKMQLGKSYLIGNLIKQITQISGVLNVNSIKVYNKFGGGYSDNKLSDDLLIDFNTGEIDTSNGFINVTNEQILQIKTPEVDINVTTTIPIS